MGLVNLRNVTILLFSLNPDRLKELKNICVKSGYKSISNSDSVQNTIMLLKQKKIDILLFDTDLGETKCEDFIKAIKTAFSKLKIVPFIANENDERALIALGINKTLKQPLSEKQLTGVLDQVVMEKMGIASSSVATNDKF